MDSSTGAACPSCGGAVRPIVYGMPGLDVVEAAQRGEVELGGCVIEEGQPHGRCTDCGAELKAAGQRWKRLEPPPPSRARDHR